MNIAFDSAGVDIDKFPLFKIAFSGLDLSNYTFIFIYHLNNNNYPYLHHWASNTDTSGIISIPYSEVGWVKHALGKITRVITPESLDEIPNYLLELAGNNSKPIILVEIG